NNFTNLFSDKFSTRYIQYIPTRVPILFGCGLHGHKNRVAKAVPAFFPSFQKTASWCKTSVVQQHRKAITCCLLLDFPKPTANVCDLASQRHFLCVRPQNDFRHIESFVQPFFRLALKQSNFAENLKNALSAGGDGTPPLPAGFFH